VSLSRVAPHDLAAEQSVLAAVIQDNALCAVAGDILSEQHFYASAHQLIWTAMRGMIAKGMAIDELTLIDALTESGTLTKSGGAAGVQALARSTVVPAHIREHAMIVRDCAVRRTLIRACSSVVESAYVRERSASELKDEAQAAILSVVQSDSGDRVLTTSEHVQALVEWLQSPESEAVVSTGLQVLDTEIADGIREGELVIIAARPSEGKSALAMQIGIHAAKAGKPVGVVTLEMTPRDLFLRSICAEEGIELQLVRTRKLDADGWKRFANGARTIAALPLEVTERAQTIEAVMAWAYSLSLQGKLGILVIDYLQLLRSEHKSESRRHEVEDMTRALKLLAMRLKIPIVLLSQLSRAVENRDGRIPELSDLRESGSIEQDADIVLMIHHPDPDPEENPKNRIPRGYCRLWLRKNRNGVRDISVSLVFEGKYVRFVPLSAYQGQVAAQSTQKASVTTAASFAQPTSKPTIPRTPAASTLPIPAPRHSTHAPQTPRPPM